MKKSIIICGFPGIGKTTLSEMIRNKFKNLSVIDSEELHSDKLTFPKSYVENIKNSLNKINVILSSANPIVIEELINQNIWFTLFYPSLKRKNEMIELYKLRADNEKMIKYMSQNYENIIYRYNNINSCNKIILENNGDFISNNEDILNLLKNFSVYES